MHMKNTEELLSRRLDDRYRLIKEQTVLKALRYLLLKHDRDKYDELNSLLNYRKRQIIAVESDHRWQYTVNGFLNISDYSFTDNEISFIANFIPRNEEGFYIDDTCTEKAHSNYNYHREEIAEINKVDRIIYKMYLEYKHIIDPLIEQCKSIEDINKIEEKIRTYLHLTPTEPPVERTNEERAHFLSGAVDTFASVYGEKGITNLIRWLNECNGFKTTEVLLEELTEELSPGASTGKYHEEFYDERLLKVMSLYSIRGDYLRDLYLTQKRQTEEFGSPKV